MNKDEAKWLLQSLRNIQFFSSFSLDNIDSVLKHFQKYSYKKGQAVINQGAEGKAFFVIYTGKVGVYKKGFLFFKNKIAELNPGNFFGEMSLIADEKVSATIKAVQKSEIFTILKTDFQKVLKENPQMQDELRYIAEKRKFETKK